MWGTPGENFLGASGRRWALPGRCYAGRSTILFDEATSSVDRDSEQEIWNCIGELAQTRTLLIISHRLSTIRDADVIYVLEKGQVSQRGSHRELMAQPGASTAAWWRSRPSWSSRERRSAAMGKRFAYSIPAMTRRLLKIAGPVKGTLWVSTLASIVGNLSQMGLMGFGALLLLSCARNGGRPALGVRRTHGFSRPAYRFGAVYRRGGLPRGGLPAFGQHAVHLYGTIRKLAPACLMDREKGDLLNIAVSDIETVEFFFAHTIGPMFTVILLPCVTLGLALWFQPLFAAVLLPVYLVVSVVFPLAAVKAGRGMGMRVPHPAGGDEIPGAGERLRPAGYPDFRLWRPRLEQVQEKNRQVNQAAHGMTLPPAGGVRGAHLLCLPGPHPRNWGGILAGGVRRAQPGGDGGALLCGGGLFFLHPVLTMVVSSLLETYAAAERLFLIEDTSPEVTEPVHPSPAGPSAPSNSTM